ncbi:MAG: glucosaminidase domain-containing protein [Methylocystaceae bacterium]|nr:glucosaminidase domain-containing protein [Methylocystaceae bacterium]
MADVSQSKSYQYVLLAVIALCTVGVALAQIFHPVNTVSKAPQSVLPLAKSKQIAKAGIDRLEGRKARDGRLSVYELNERFSKIGYELDPVLNGQNAVPRVFVRSLPYDLSMLKQAEERKSMFFRTLLPLVLKINEEILANRAKVWALRHRLNIGLELKAEDRIWLDAAFSRYRVKPGKFDTLLTKLDMVPPSLILAQAAEESGWGTSRFAREGNALFGQWTFNPKDKGIVPLGRPAGKTHRIKSFDDLAGSLRSYIRNLNSHKAYAPLRQMRKQMRRKGQEFDGYRLAGTLDKYSERGEEYIVSIQSIMDKNDLRRFDGATLDDTDLNITVDRPLI